MIKTVYNEVEKGGFCKFLGRICDKIGWFCCKKGVFRRCTQVNFHLYHYAGNNPVKYTDPDGEALHIAIGALVGGLSSAIAGGSLQILNDVKGYKKQVGANPNISVLDDGTVKLEGVGDFKGKSIKTDLNFEDYLGYWGI